MLNLPSWLSSARLYQLCPQAFADQDALPQLQQWFSHVHQLGCNTLALSNVWQSCSDDSDIRDYLQLSPRLGTNEQFKRFVEAAHQQGLKVVIDAQFNFVGRDFFAVQDLLSQQQQSAYLNWFMRIQFDGNNDYRDGLVYQHWQDQPHRVQLNTGNSDVQRYFLNVLDDWHRQFGIDGIRLLGAEALDTGFVRSLRRQCDSYEDFWLAAEVLESDAAHWLQADGVHSITNYPAFKALWSSLNSVNMYELDYCLSRQFGQRNGSNGLQQQIFLDGPELSRISSRLKVNSQLFPLYLLLYLIPGVPSLYYGSEWRAKGVTNRHGNEHLQPDEQALVALSHGEQDLKDAIARFNELRRQVPELASDRFRSVDVQSDFIAFERGDNLLCLVNASHSPLRFELPTGHYHDLLNDEHMDLHGHVFVPPMWGRVLRRG